jgi:hypothetical protein
MNQILGQSSYVRTHSGADMSKVYPRFFNDTVQDQIASAREGRPIFKEEERVEIIMPGISQLTKPVERVTQEHIDRWPEAYKAFKSGQEMSVTGTPLEQWPILKRPQVLELKAAGFLTVEQVAEMSDHAIQRVGMMGRRLKELAVGYLDDEKGQASLAKATAERDRQERIIEEQNEKIANLQAMLERVSADLIAIQNRPHPIATYVPGQHDPIGASVQAQPQPPSAQSSLMDLPAPRQRKGKAEVAS